ncbi:hypothetical protein AU467_34070 [Mesorhizobium loti]|uniref:Biotin synthase n=1 Tax=Rhizobium loti TaxID=381 RepID=A0A101KLQ3_RHILI|nr:hypothetical protein AU467_34070 [Mesorhizobium loti]
MNAVTRTFADRLDMLANVRESGIKVCCGGIVGMGEEKADRIEMLVTLANLPEPPDSVPHHRARPPHDTEIACAALGRPRGSERRDAGAGTSFR